MRFTKGHEKIPNSGRKVGSKNKRKIPKVADFLAEQGINPAAELLNMIESGDLSPHAVSQIWLDLLSYVQAKPKEIEADDDATNDDDLIAKFKSLSPGEILRLVRSPDEAS